MVVLLLRCSVQSMIYGTWNVDSLESALRARLGRIPPSSTSGCTSQGSPGSMSYVAFRALHFGPMVLRAKDPVLVSC